MSEPVKGDGTIPPTTSAPAEALKPAGAIPNANIKPEKPPNPVFRMMGEPNAR